MAAGNYAAIAISFATSVVLTHSLGTVEYGRLALLLTVSQILAFLVSQWTLTAVVQYGAREFASKASLARTFWSRTVLALPWLGVAAAAFVVFGAEIARLLDIPTWGVWLVFAHFVLAAAVGTASSVLQAMNRMPRYGVGLVLDRAIALFLVLALLRLGSLDALRALACYTASSAVVAVFLYASIGRRPLRPIRADRAHVSTMWRFSLPVVASQWLGLFGTQWTDYLVIRRYLAVEELGLYSLAYQLAGVLQQITSIVATLMLPRYSLLALAGNDAQLRRILGRLLPYWLLTYALALCIALAFAPFAIGIVFGDGFAGTASPFALLIVASIELAIFNTFSSLLTGYERMWPLTLSVIASAAVNIGLDLALVPQFGISGAALSTVAAYGTSAVVALATARVQLGLPVLRYAAFVLPVAVAYAASVTLSGWTAGVASVALGAVVTLAVARAFGLRPREDLAALTGRAPS